MSDDIADARRIAELLRRQPDYAAQGMSRDRLIMLGELMELDDQLDVEWNIWSTADRNKTIERIMQAQQTIKHFRWAIESPDHQGELIAGVIQRQGQFRLVDAFYPRVGGGRRQSAPDANRNADAAVRAETLRKRTTFQEGIRRFGQHVIRVYGGGNNGGGGIGQ